MNGMVAALFERLERSGIRYVLLRNYEQLCDEPSQAAEQATDIDLVIATEDIPRWREIAISLADDFGWDALTECDHFTQSRKREHHIQIFRYYRHSGQGFLQVDLFHSYLIWGLPFLTGRELLAGRVADQQRGLTRIDPVQENTFRLLQIQGLIGDGHAAGKIARYRDRVLRFDREQGPLWREFLNRSLGGRAAEILDALTRQDWPRYSQAMRMGKASFWSRFAAGRPVQATQFLVARLLEARRRYLSRPCGPLFKVYVEDAKARDRLVEILNELKRLNFIDQWSARDSGARLDKAALVIREQGGLLIRWAPSEHADLIVSSGRSGGEIRRQIVEMLVRRHSALYLRPAVQPPRVFRNVRVEA